jgi:hypothetical protein
LGTSGMGNCARKCLSGWFDMILLLFTLKRNRNRVQVAGA